MVCVHERKQCSLCETPPRVKGPAGCLGRCGFVSTAAHAAQTRSKMLEEMHSVLTVQEETSAAPAALVRWAGQACGAADPAGQ
jgi:hypothetical protein